MRIAMVAPVDLRVPPVGYGGTELVVSLLTEELVQRGHDVTLFASGDSITSAELVPACDRFVRGSGRELGVLMLLNASNAYARAEEFDIIHNHTCAEGLALAQLVQTPTLTTFHGHLSPDTADLFSRYRQWYVSISRSARDLTPPGGRFAGVVHNGINASSFPFNPGPREDFLLFLSRMSREKGPHLAIQAAKTAGRRLVMAGNVDRPDEEYFRTEVQPLIDGDQIQYLGEADVSMKRDLMSRAEWLLAPITWPEPFGLFMVEAMACGTPVVVLNNGSAKELVVHGQTGYVVESVSEMAAIVQNAPHTIDPYECRQHVEQQFNVPRMTDEYLATYHRIASAELPREDILRFEPALAPPEPLPA